MKHSKFSIISINLVLTAIVIYLLSSYIPKQPLDWLLVLVFSIAVTIIHGRKKPVLTNENLLSEHVILTMYALNHGMFTVWVVALGLFLFSLLQNLERYNTLYLLWSRSISLWCALSVYRIMGGVFGAVSLVKNPMPLLLFTVSYLAVLAACTIVNKQVNITYKRKVIKAAPYTVLGVIYGIFAAQIYQYNGLAGAFVLILLSSIVSGSITAYHKEQRYVKAMGRLPNVRLTQQEREQREFTIYRDVMSSVTQDKLRLTLQDEIYQYITDVPVHAEMHIASAYDVAEARNIVRATLADLPISKQRQTRLVLCVSEAVTNVVKHSGSGKLLIFTSPEFIRIWIQDTGPGIEISRLPLAILRKGYSTKVSLGCGFSIMLDYLDRLILSTKGSTILILEMQFNQQNEEGTGERVIDQHAG